MTDDQDPLESVSVDLAEARSRIDAARAALQPALELREADPDAIRQAASRLERIAAGLARIERECSAHSDAVTA